MHGQAEVNHSLAVTQQRQRQIERQIGRILAVDPFAKRQVIDDDSVFAFQFSLIDFVFEIKRELAGLNRPTREFSGIGREIFHLQIAKGGFQIGVLSRAKRRQITRQSRQTELIHLAFHRHFSA